MRTYVTLTLLGVAAISSAATGIVPNGYDNTDGDGVFALSSTGTTRTYQIQIHESQLTGFLNTKLNGLQWRLDPSATADWPDVSATFSQFDIYLGQGVAPSLRSSTFANNFVGAKTQVRSGALAVNPGDFSIAGGQVKPWGPTVSFNDYLYTGGNLTLEMRYSVQSGSSVQPKFDALTAQAAGYGTLYSSNWALDSTATDAFFNNSNVLVTQFSSTPVPEPATLAVLGIGAVAMLRRRRK